MKERKLRSDRYSENGELKKCSGFLHRENPVMLPLTQFHMLKSGHMAGKPMAECIECWRARRGLDPAQRRIDRAEWFPVYSRLIEIVGSQREVARRIGRFPSTLSRAQKNRQMGADLFRDLENLLREVEKEKQGKLYSFNAGEAEVVDAAPFAQVLNKFIDDWNRDRLPGHYAESENGDDSKQGFYGPIEWLSEKTEINVRRINAFKRQEIDNVPLSQADALLQAMNLTHYLWNNRIQVKPNPQWSMEKYQEYMRSRGCI